MYLPLKIKDPSVVVGVSSHSASNCMCACARCGSCQHSEFAQFYTPAYVKFIAVTEVNTDIRFDGLTAVILKHVTSQSLQTELCACKMHVIHYPDVSLRLPALESLLRNE